MEIGRETLDLGFLLIQMEASEKEIKNAMIELAAISSTDGFLFHCEDINPLEQPHMKYSGYRVKFEAQFGRMKDRISILEQTMVRTTT